jgi:hypothetical protein
MRNYEGEITIEGSAFWAWILENCLPNTGDEIVFGPPVWDKETQTLRIRYAGSNECSPMSWAKKPELG